MQLVLSILIVSVIKKNIPCILNALQELRATYDHMFTILTFSIGHQSENNQLDTGETGFLHNICLFLV